MVACLLLLMMAQDPIQGESYGCANALVVIECMFNLKT